MGRGNLGARGVAKRDGNVLEFPAALYICLIVSGQRRNDG